MKKFFTLSVGLFLCLSLVSCQSKPAAIWSAASLRNEDGLFVLPGAQPRASFAEIEQVLGCTLEPKEEISNYSKDAARIYIPVNDGEAIQFELCGCSTNLELWFDFPDENNVEEIDSISMNFTGNEAQKVVKAFREEAESLWGEPVVRTQEGVISINGKREIAVREMWEWRDNGDEYITVLAAGTLTHSGEVIEFLVEWGTYETADYQ